MKISKVEGAEALDVWADLLEPITAIASDKEFEKLYKSKPLVFAVKYVMKNHKSEILEVLALMQGEDVETFRPSFFELPKMIFELLNDKDIQELFQSQQIVTKDDSLSAVTQSGEGPETM
jgi:hypothetical protein